MIGRVGEHVDGTDSRTHTVTVTLALFLALMLLGGRLGLLRNSQPVLVSEATPSSHRGRQGADPSSASSRRACPSLFRQAYTRPRGVLGETDPEERRNVQIYAQVNKSVVNITTESEGAGFFGDETSTGTGSGFVIDTSGHVMTNYHVIEGADAVRVDVVRTARRTRPRSSARTPQTMSPCSRSRSRRPAFPVKFGDSSRLLVGQKILAVGNPFGLERFSTKYAQITTCSNGSTAPSAHDHRRRRRRACARIALRRRLGRAA